ARWCVVLRRVRKGWRVPIRAQGFGIFSPAFANAHPNPAAEQPPFHRQQPLDSTGVDPRLPGGNTPRPETKLISARNPPQVIRAAGICLGQFRPEIRLPRPSSPPVGGQKSPIAYPNPTTIVPP